MKHNVLAENKRNRESLAIMNVLDFTFGHEPEVEVSLRDSIIPDYERYTLRLLFTLILELLTCNIYLTKYACANNV